jgi:hypothetical protein
VVESGLAGCCTGSVRGGVDRGSFSFSIRNVRSWRIARSPLAKGSRRAYNENIEISAAQRHSNRKRPVPCRPLSFYLLAHPVGNAKHTPPFPSQTFIAPPPQGRGGVGAIYAGRSGKGCGKIGRGEREKAGESVTPPSAEAAVGGKRGLALPKA